MESAVNNKDLRISVNKTKYIVVNQEQKGQFTKLEIAVESKNSII